MELPTISTGWGGNTQFMTPQNSYLIRCVLLCMRHAASSGHSSSSRLMMMQGEGV